MLNVEAAIAEELAAAGIRFFGNRPGTRPNHWLNAIVAHDLAERDAIIQGTIGLGMTTRPIWRLMPSLAMYNDCETDGLANSRWLEERVVNIPSSVPNGALENKQ